MDRDSREDFPGFFSEHRAGQFEQSMQYMQIVLPVPYLAHGAGGVFKLLKLFFDACTANRIWASVFCTPKSSQSIYEYGSDPIPKSADTTIVIKGKQIF